MRDFGLVEPEPEAGKVAAPEIDKSLLAQIRPRVTPRATSNLAESDRVAAAAGFVSREPQNPATDPYIRPILRRGKAVQRQTLSMSPSITVYNRFKQYCETRDISCPRALERLLDESEELARLRRGQ